MQHLELDLAVGDVVRIGDRWLTVMELDGDEVLFQLTDGDGYDSEPTFELRPR